MERLAERRLENWFGRKARLPLFLHGQRGVGKTHLLRKFGREKFGKVLYFDIKGDFRSKKIFDAESSGRDIIAAITSFAGHVPDSETFVILDNIHESSAALDFLRRSPELLPGVGVIGAGRLPKWFECKNIELLELRPMCFREFLIANGKDSLAETLEGCTAGILGKAAEFEYWMRLHICVGGLPGAMKCYSETRDFRAAYEANRSVLDMYGRDLSECQAFPFSRMGGNFWHLLADHFGGEYQSFEWGNIRLGKCVHFYEKALPWGIGCGLGSAVENLCDLRKEPPLIGKRYKVYYSDTGLLCSMGRERALRLLCDPNWRIGFQAAEHYVLNEIRAHTGYPVFYSGNDRNELIRFVVSRGSELVPVEVNPFDNLKIGCLDRYCRRHSPGKAVRACMREFQTCTGICKVPMYAIGHFFAGFSK